MILTPVVPNLIQSLVMTRARGVCYTRSLCCIAFYIHRVKRVPHYILGQEGYFLEVSVMAFLASGIKTCILGAQFCCQK